MVQIVWNSEEKSIFFAYDGYNQQTIHIFVRAIVLILFIFAKRKRKEQQKSILHCCKKGIFWQADNLGGEKSVVSK